MAPRVCGGVRSSPGLPQPRHSSFGTRFVEGCDQQLSRGRSGPAIEPTSCCEVDIISARRLDVASIDQNRRRAKEMQSSSLLDIPDGNLLYGRLDAKILHRIA